jgi:CheY-like chemotaxis protein
VGSNVKELQQAIGKWSPEVVVTDIRMPPSGNDDGIRVAARLRETSPNVGVVVLSQYAEPAYALALFEKGTGGRAYLLKERVRKRDELIGAIEKVAQGGSIIDPAIVDVLIEARLPCGGERRAHRQLGRRRLEGANHARWPRPAPSPSCARRARPAGPHRDPRSPRVTSRAVPRAPLGRASLCSGETRHRYGNCEGIRSFPPRRPRAG